MNNLRFQEFYKRRLPHIQVAGATYFVTFRLKNSLPVEVLDTLSKEFEQNKILTGDKNEIELQWFEKFDSYLDQVISGENYLSNPQIANVSSSRKGLNMVNMVLTKETKNHVQAYNQGYPNNSF